MLEELINEFVKVFFGEAPQWLSCITIGVISLSVIVSICKNGLNIGRVIVAFLYAWYSYEAITMPPVGGGITIVLLILSAISIFRDFN